MAVKKNYLDGVLKQKVVFGNPWRDWSKRTHTWTILTTSLFLTLFQYSRFPQNKRLEELEERGKVEN